MAEVEPARLRGNPYFLRHGMPVDDDFAAIGELDFEHAAGCQLEIQIGIALFEPALDPIQRNACKGGEFSVIHTVLPSNFSRYRPMRHTIILAALLALTACGTRGNLVLPPGPKPAPVFGNPPASKTKMKPEHPAPETSVEPSGAGGDLNTAPTPSQ